MKKLLLFLLLIPIECISQTIFQPNSRDCPPGHVKKFYEHSWKCVEERTLPVELLYFKGVQSYEDVTLYWSTASELNADYYQIEGSNDAIIFEPLMKVNSNFNSTTQQQYYQQRVRKYRYYRLCQVDLDSTKITYNIISVLFKEIKYQQLSSYDSIGRLIN